MNKIDNISFTYEAYGIEFTYRESFNKNKQSKAYLQLPSTGDSVHYINDVEVDRWGSDEEREVIIQLMGYYFSSFKKNDGELGAASAQVREQVFKVQEVSFVNMDFYVAFTDNSAYVLKESRSRSYYNKTYLFDDTDFEDFDVIKTAGEDSCLIDKLEVIELAEKELGKTLSRWCTKKMQAYLDSAIKSDSSAHISSSDIGQCFGDTLDDFMRDNFEENYMEIEVASKWYSDFGCDIAGDFKNQAMEYQEVE